MILERRLIAMLDVLGFAGRIGTREALRETTATYAALIDRANKHMFSPAPVAGSPNAPEPNFEYGQFAFDNLVLASYATDIKAAYRFIFATILLMDLFFAERYPLRGCIGIGDLCGDEKGQIVLSDAFKRLDFAGKNQQWMGCILLEDAEGLVLPSLLGYSQNQAQTARLLRSAPLHWLPVPLKKAPEGHRYHWCLNWSYFLSPATIAAGLDYLKGDLVKHENTARYLERLAELDDDAQHLSPAFLPARRMKVMKARSGVRIKFEDDQGNGVQPGCDWTFAACERDV
jgi:hypothetical protein